MKALTLLAKWWKMVGDQLKREFTAKEVKTILERLIGNDGSIGLALLNYYARTDLVAPSGRTEHRGRTKYTFSDVVLLSWLFRMKREGLPVNRFRQGLAYLRKRLPELYKNPKDMMLVTDGKNLYVHHRISEKQQIAEILTGKNSGQYVWAFGIGSLIEEINDAIEEVIPQDRKKSASA